MILIAMAVAAASPAAEAVFGHWQTETRRGVVEIAACGTSICGRLIGSDGLRENPNLTDARNQDVAKRSRPLKGLLMLSGFTRDGAAWTSGTIYNPDDGKEYKATVTPDGPDRLKVRGCIFVPFCKTQTWIRLQ